MRERANPRFGGPAIVSLAALVFVAAASGLLMGFRLATLDATDVISRYARHHAELTGRSPADCVGVPGRGDLWLEVICGGDPRRIYGVSRFGFAVDIPGERRH